MNFLNNFSCSWNDDDDSSGCGDFLAYFWIYMGNFGFVFGVHIFQSEENFSLSKTITSFIKSSVFSGYFNSKKNIYYSFYISTQSISISSTLCNNSCFFSTFRIFSHSCLNELIHLIFCRWFPAVFRFSLILYFFLCFRLRLICYYGLRCLNDLRVGTYSPPEYFGSVYFVSWWRKTAKYSIFSMQPWFFSACNRLCFLLLF